jgi:hypothetical protein
LFGDFSLSTSEDNFNRESPDGKYKKVSTFKAKLHNCTFGIREYVPIVFDDMHFCCV